MTSPAPASLHTITLYQNKRIAVGERHTVDLSEFLSSPLRIDCGPSDKEIKRAKETCALWSPGTFANNHRQKKNVESIFALGFDLDEEPVVTFDLACSKLAAVAGHLTTSFRHRTDAPRLRLIALLSRPVNADEYARLWTYYQRRLVGLGMGVGAAAKDPSRGWFVPSSPNLPGHEYRHARLPGTPIDVDQDLALADSYAEDEPEPEHKPRRAAAGILERARLYVETWDPAIEGSGGSNLAFAHIERLVRGFDLTDDDALTVLASWNKRCKPPWSKKELLHKIRQGRERGDTNWGDLRTNVFSIQSGLPFSPPNKSEDAIKLILTDSQVPAKIEENVARMIRAYPVKIRLDTFSMRVWHGDKPINDNDISVIRGWLFDRPKTERVEASFDTVYRGIGLAAERVKFHPVCDYLDSVMQRWDRVPRVDRFFVDYWGVEDDLYSRVSSRLFLLGLVARVRDPGCKLDETPILEGPQGLKKSSGLAALVGNDWFRDTKINLGDKDSYQNLPGSWLYEMPELASTRTRDTESVKSFMTSPFDDLRPSYGRTVVRYYRQCAFAGTTNEPKYLVDRSGNRRWLCMKCTKVKRIEIARDRDQIWAEAALLYAANPKTWWERPDEFTALQKRATKERETEELWEGAIDGLVPEDIDGKTSYAILTRIGIDISQQNPFAASRLGHVLRDRGWEQSRVHSGPRVWRKT